MIKKTINGLMSNAIINMALNKIATKLLYSAKACGGYRVSNKPKNTNRYKANNHPNDI